MTDLTGKVAVITGASSGIGLATAELLAAEGVNLVIHGRRKDLLDANAERLSAGGATCVAVAADIMDPATHDLLLDTAVERFGHVDIAFNNAGLLHIGSIDDVDLDKLSAMIRVNVEAATRFAYTALRRFKARGSGHLLTTTSVLGTKVRPMNGVYCATKFALEALMEALRMELAGTGIKVTCVEPGLVRSDMHREFPVRPEKMQGFETPLSPPDVARAVLFALTQPDHVLVPRVMVLPSQQPV